MTAKLEKRMPVELMPQTLSIIGSGGHASVVLDAALLENFDRIIEVFDEYQEGCLILGLCVRSGLPDSQFVHVAIGDNQIRQHIGYALEGQGKSLYSVVHPKSIVARSANIGPGCFIAANAIIAPRAKVDMGCIINHSAVVDHDCFVGAWTHIAPNVTLGGNVQVGEGCLIGAGAVVLPGISIGERAIVGAGSVVTRAVLANQMVVGVPARLGEKTPKNQV